MADFDEAIAPAGTTPETPKSKSKTTSKGPSEKVPSKTQNLGRLVAPKQDGKNTLLRILIVVIALIAVMFILGGSFINVPAGHKGVILSSPSGPSNEEIDEGWHFSPYYLLTDVAIVEYRTQTVNFVGSDQADDEVGSIAVSSKDNILVYMDFSIVYHIDEENVANLIVDTGLNYRERVIMPVARSTPRDIAANYNAIEIRGERRGIIEQDISNNITTALAERDIIVEDFAMRDIRLPARLEDAIEEKKVAEQNVLTQQFNLEAEQYVANKTVVQANATRVAEIIRAQAFANATVIRADGQSDAIRTIMTALNSSDVDNRTREYLQWLYIGALNDPNSNISYIIVPSEGGVPILVQVAKEESTGG